MCVVQCGRVERRVKIREWVGGGGVTVVGGADCVAG